MRSCSKRVTAWCRTDLQYGDFILELDYKALNTEFYDSGIYIRAPFPAKSPKRAWPDKYQINLKKGEEANLLGLQGGTSTGLVKPNEWNHLKITVQGDTVAMEINGQPAWKASGLDVDRGYIGLQAEVAGGGQFLFKDIKLTELGLTPLINGTDLTGWVGDTKGYTPKDGKIVIEKGKGGNLYTEKEYQDFVFRFEFLLEPGRIYGLGILAPPLTGDAAYTGMELQILDDDHGATRCTKGFNRTNRTVSLWHRPRQTGPSEAAGEWNSARGDRARTASHRNPQRDRDRRCEPRRSRSRRQDHRQEPASRTEERQRPHRFSRPRLACRVPQSAD